MYNISSVQMGILVVFCVIDSYHGCIYCVILFMWFSFNLFKKYTVIQEDRHPLQFSFGPIRLLGGMSYKNWYEHLRKYTTGGTIQDDIMNIIVISK